MRLLSLKVLTDGAELEDAGAGLDLEQALATAEDPAADESELEHRAAVLAKMSHLPEAKEKIEIVSRAQYAPLLCSIGRESTMTASGTD